MFEIQRALRLRAVLAAILFVPAGGFTQSVRAEGDEHRHSGNSALFNGKEYHDHIEYLASDALEGRGTGQEGIDKAAEFIVKEFKACGVKPAGDDGTYFQNFTLKLKNKVAEGTRLAIGTSASVGKKNAKLNQDYTPLPFSGKGDFKGDVVFVGYGMGEEEYDDYAGLDVSGKVVLMLRRAPKFKDFGAMRSSFRAKASKANGQNAAAILIVNPSFDEDGDKLFDFNTDNFSGGMMMGRRGYGIPMVQISRGLADKMLKAGGLASLDKVEKKIESSEKPCSAALKGVTVKGTVNIEPIETPVRNIVGLIPGTGPQKDEIIILGGHYDHLGIRHKGEEGFDSTKDISNGADDNASGTSMIMTLAKAYTKGARPNHSLLLMCFTGEELGLLGSQHFAGEPTIDLDKAVAMLNFDMVGRLKDDKLEVGGMKTGGFEDSVKRHAEEYNLKIKDGGGGRGPSDHTSFYNKNIPVLFFFTGIHKQYHQPTDDTPLINVDGAMRVGRFAADIIDDIDQQEERPVFAKDNRTASISRQDAEDDKGQPNQAADATPGRRGGPGGRFGNRPRLGIRPDMNSEEDGIVISEVVEGGAAEKAGLKEGDRIVEINGKKTDSPMAMFDLMQNLKWEDTPKIVAMRGGKKVSVQLKFEKPPAAAADQTAKAGDSNDVKGLIAALKTALETKDGSLDLSVKVDTSKSDVVELTLRFKKPDGKSQKADTSKSQNEERPRNRSGERRRPRADRDDSTADPHAGAEAEQHAMERPTVRLGIMPTYGESEGEGFEISGVVDGGPAARAGMKDDDRILKIGDKKVSNIYEYMEALKKYKPGDEVSVTVLRKGKQVNLKIKSASQERKEAA